MSSKIHNVIYNLQYMFCIHFKHQDMLAELSPGANKSTFGTGS